MIFSLIYLFTGIFCSAIAFYFFHKSSGKHIAILLQENKLLKDENGRLLVKSGVLEEQVRTLQSDKEEFNLLKKTHQQLHIDFTNAQAQLVAANEKLENQKQELEGIGDRFKFEFKNLAQNILEEKTERFTELNQANMKAILEPLKTEIGDFKIKVEETYDKESKERFSLEKEVGRLIEMTQHVSQEAHNLTTALKGNNKMQGNWGELILESLLEHSGLTKGREYFTQEFLRDKTGKIINDENGKALQPDIMICYPDDRKIIIDSKVSLNAWDECVAGESKEDQQRYLREHIASLRRHIDGLSRKNYPKYALALDYVLLFIPIEPAFLEAVKSDLNLWKYAYDKKILLVSPTNLFAVLKIIADLWKVEQQNQNAIAIANKAGAMYDKFALFLESFQGVGSKINDASELYSKALNQLSTGRGNVIGRIEELKQMGANAAKQLPDKLIEQSILITEPGVFE